MPHSLQDSDDPPTLHAAIQRERGDFERWLEEEADLPVGVNAVLEALDGMLQRYVRTVWVDVELARMDDERAHAAVPRKGQTDAACVAWRLTCKVPRWQW